MLLLDSVPARFTAILFYVDDHGPFWIKGSELEWARNQRNRLNHKNQPAPAAAKGVREVAVEKKVRVPLSQPDVTEPNRILF